MMATLHSLNIPLSILSLFGKEHDWEGLYRLESSPLLLRAPHHIYPFHKVIKLYLKNQGGLKSGSGGNCSCDQEAVLQPHCSKGQETFFLIFTFHLFLPSLSPFYSCDNVVLLLKSFHFLAGVYPQLYFSRQWSDASSTCVLLRKTGQVLLVSSCKTDSPFSMIIWVSFLCTCPLLSSW